MTRRGARWGSELEGGVMICDFCTFPVVAWRFEATPFGLDYGHAIATSDSGWAACEECAELILAGDRGGLVERALRISPGIPGAPEDEVRELQRWAHDLFFIHRLDIPPARIEAVMPC
jgi:hypothetical protein